MRTPPPEPKNCANCGKLFSIRNSGKSRESRSKFAKRMYCCNECHIAKLSLALQGVPKGSASLTARKLTDLEAMQLQFITGNPNIAGVFDRTVFGKLNYLKEV